jgi:hypothetical protein
MAMKKTIPFLFTLLVTLAWVLWSATPAQAETLNYKSYTWVIKSDDVPVGDVEGRNVGIRVRGGFYVFENGEVATTNSVNTQDFVKGSGSYMRYITINFEDGSTIIIKSQGNTIGRAAGRSYATSEATGEIIKGTGRFEGIKGTEKVKFKYLPVIKGEPGSRGYGEGTITYTLPSK